MTGPQLFLSDKAKATAHAPWGEPQDGFFSPLPTLLKKPLICTGSNDMNGIIHFERSAANMNAKEFEAKKIELADFIESVYATVRENGYEDPLNSEKRLTRDPQNKYELLSLCKEILPMMHGQYPFSPDNPVLLVTAIASGSLDCDTSSLVVADILNQFGVKSMLVSMRGHVNLRVSAGGGSFYLETTDEGAITYPDFATLKKEYAMRKLPAIFYGECEFSVVNPVTYYSRGLARFMNGDNEGAISDINEVTRLNPKNAEAYIVRGYAKHNMGDYKGAIGDYSKAIHLNPKIADIYLSRGQAKSFLGDIKGKIKDYNRAIRLNPKDAGTYSDLGFIKLELGDYKGAIKDCDKAISLDPKHAYAYNNRGAAKYHLGDYKGALEDCDKSISLDSENAYAYLNRADIKLKLGYTGGAITDYAKAARLFRAQGLDAKAKDAWDRASKL